jgi:hypothetical protein
MDVKTALSKLKEHAEKQENEKYYRSDINADGLLKRKDFVLGNAVKYLVRYMAQSGEKRGQVEDLLKAAHYLLFEIENRTNNPAQTKLFDTVEGLDRLSALLKNVADQRRGRAMQFNPGGNFPEMKFGNKNPRVFDGMAGIVDTTERVINKEPLREGNWGKKDSSERSPAFGASHSKALDGIIALGFKPKRSACAFSAYAISLFGQEHVLEIGENYEWVLSADGNSIRFGNSFDEFAVEEIRKYIVI